MTHLIKKHNLQFLVSKSTNRIKWWVDVFAKWEDETFTVFDKVLVKEKNFIDLGAWIGTTCLYASLLSDKVYAIEADPVSLADLNQNIKVNNFDNITVVGRPIFNIDTELYFGPYQSHNNWNTSSSMIKSVSDNKLDIVLKTITFKNLISDYNIENLSLIKVDIEGAEENIIADVFEYVKSSKVKPAIYLSYHYSWWKNQSNLEILSKYWKTYKYAYYKLKLVDADSINKIIKEDPFGSVLFTDFEIQF